MNYYHVYNRGVSKELIFRSRENYLFLLGKAKEFLINLPVSVVAYCLMPTHYHFLLEAERMQAGRFIQRLFNSYTQALNKMHSRTGTLFEGRAKFKLIQTDEYLLQLARYIHLNPVEAGLVRAPLDWEFSNYAEWTQKRNGVLVKSSLVQQYFPQPSDYEEFVAIHSGS